MNAPRSITVSNRPAVFSVPVREKSNIRAAIDDAMALPVATGTMNDKGIEIFRPFSQILIAVAKIAAAYRSTGETDDFCVIVNKVEIAEKDAVPSCLLFNTTPENFKLWAESVKLWEKIS
jgi:hypothetical protein